MSIFGILTEGGQTWAHRIRMLRQVIKTACTVAFVISVMVLIALLIRVHPFLYLSAWYYLKASTLGILYDTISVDPEFWASVANESFASGEVWVSSQKATTITEPYVNYLTERLIEIFEIVGLVSAYSALGMLAFFLLRGIFSKRKQHVAGRKKSNALWLSIKLTITRKASFLRIGKVPLIKNTETQHILVSGGTGSGKTNCFHHLLPQIRNAGHKAIIVDTTGVFFEKYYREGKDLFLNPFETRGLPWHPWVECKESFDYDSLAESFIPHSYSQHENYWNNAARTLLSALLQKTAEERKTTEIYRWLHLETLAKLCAFVQGTKAGAHLDIGSEKTASSIRSVACSFLDCLEYITDTKQPFSIKEWVHDETCDSWLFLSCKPSQRATLNPLISCWFSTAARSLMQLKPDRSRRIWFVADELPSLHRLKDLEVFVSESRKYGGCGLFAFQSPAQLEAIYGSAIAKTIIGNCMTKIVFAEQDPQTAEMISKAFGEREIKEYQEGLSYGAHETRDGVNLSLHTKREPLVSPTDIQSLERNQAFLKLPGNLPVTKVKFPISKKH